jgi:MYXO-CTERM domain-containing protein
VQRTSSALLLLAIGAGLGGGCAAETDWSTRLGEYSWPIVSGTRESGENAVVFVYNDRGGGCTAWVIAPRVVVTAKHCIQGTSASGWHVLVGPSMSSVRREYAVSEQRTTPGSSIEECDIAVLILTEDFEYGFKRWEFTPWPGFRAGAAIEAIGYGQTNPDDPYSAGTKYRRGGSVVELTGGTEFITYGENTCQGDSGGPILFGDVVVGVVSRGEAGCTGYGIMTRVSGMADLVLQALRDTGACVPTSLEVCNGIDDDCWEGPDNGLGPTCACSDGGAPRAETCNGIDDDCNAAIDDLPNCACTGGAAPGVETCNGIDDDCNGVIDDPCARLGQPCGADTECSTGLCLDTGVGSRVCTARCVAGSGAACPDGGYCDAMACGEGLCRPAGEGGGSPLGATCANGGDCISRFCAVQADGASVCARSCTPGTLSCFAGEVCSALADACGACLASGAVPGARGFGEPCRSDGECLSGFCFTDGDPAACGDSCAYRYCTASCGAAGECPDGAHCREGICVRGPLSDAGDTCVSDADCIAGVCVAPPGGTPRCVEACSAEGACAESFVCVDGSCWPGTMRPGDPCAAPEDFCEGGLCVDVGGTLACVSACADVGDCNSGTSCVAGPDGAGVCAPPFAAGGGGGGDGCNCAAPGSPTSSASSLLFLLGVALLLTLRRP